MNSTSVLACALALVFAVEAQAQTAAGGVGGTTPLDPAPPSAYASSVTVPMSGHQSFDGLWDTSTEFFGVPAAAPGSYLTALSWDLSITTHGASRFRDAFVYLDGSDMDGVNYIEFAPAEGNAGSGTQTFSSGGIRDAFALGDPVLVRSDGKIWFYLYDSPDDLPNAPDATYVSGSITLYFDANCGSTVNSFGTACPGNGGYLPALTVSGCPQVGTPVTIEFTDCDGGANAFLIFSNGSGSVGLPSGCTLDLAIPYRVLPLGLLPGVGAGAGSYSASESPLQPGHVFMQALIKDSTAGLITSNGQDVTILP